MSDWDPFEELDAYETKRTREEILKPPFGYPGGKSKSVLQILGHLPYGKRYIEPYGGSAALLLARKSSRLEVFNDRYAGVTSFYRCIKNRDKMRQLCDWLELTVHSREEFLLCRDTWENTHSDVERAARWYYMTQYSFGTMGRNFGRSTSPKAILASLRKKLKLFPLIHSRFEHVQVENQDGIDCVIDYDAPDAVFYVDPPYVDSHAGAYKHIMKHAAHRRLLETIDNSKGFFAVSGYSNPIYEDTIEWDERHEFKAFVSLQAMAFKDSNQKADVEGINKRTHAQEILWIRRAR